MKSTHKNSLVDLQNHLFEMIEKLNDDSLVGDDLEQEIKRSLTINELARTAVANGGLMVKAVDTVYGLPVSDQLPLIPFNEEEKGKYWDKVRKKNEESPRATEEPPRIGRNVAV